MFRLVPQDYVDPQTGSCYHLLRTQMKTIKTPGSQGIRSRKRFGRCLHPEQMAVHRVHECAGGPDHVLFLLRAPCLVLVKKKDGRPDHAG